MTAASRGRTQGGFTLLEVLVAVAILAVTIIPMLLLREDSYNKAFSTKLIRVVQELAQQELSVIALEVRYGEGSGEFEEWPEIRFEYKVTLYDFGMGTEETEEDKENNLFNPEDSVFPEDDREGYGPMVMRHVELTLFYFSLDETGEETEKEYVIDTYIPTLLTEEQFEYSLNQTTSEEQ